MLQEKIVYTRIDFLRERLVPSLDMVKVSLSEQINFIARPVQISQNLVDSRSIYTGHI